MIQIDISNIWGQIDLPDLLAIEKEADQAHQLLSSGTGRGAALRGWLKLPTAEPTPELERIQAAAEQIRSDSSVCVVVGMDDVCLGSRAALELLQGKNRNLPRGKGDPQIFYAGNTLSTRQWNELVRLLEGKDFSLVVISKSGADLESAIAFRGLKWILERRYGTEEANNRIYTVTDPEEGALRQMAREQSWQSFSLPQTVGERFSPMTAAGLLPMAVAGIDIRMVLAGAARAREEYDLRSFENPVWLYAAVRNLMYRSGKAMEILSAPEPDFCCFGLWWQQLFGESEGKEGKGLIPVPAELSTLDQRIREGRQNLFETLVRFAPPEQGYTVGSDVKDLDGLNYLAGKALDQVQDQAILATVEAHVDGGTPVITLDCGQVTEESVGELFCFLQLSCAISAYILGVNPFDRPGAESCRETVAQALGKPAPEAGGEKLPGNS